MTWPDVPTRVVVARVADDTVVFDRATGRLSRLDPVAALVLAERDRFAGIEDAAQLLHEVFGVDLPTMRSDLAELERALRLEGLPAGDPIDWRSRPAPEPPSTSPCFERSIDCLGLAALVRCHEPSIAAALEPLIARHTTIRRAVRVLEIWSAPQGIVVAQDGEQLVAGADLWSAISEVIAALTLLAMNAETTNVRLHAGAVVRDGRAVVVAGAADQGKTSTVVELCSSGAAFMADEIVEIDVPRRCVIGWPRAVGLEGPIRSRHEALRPAWWEEGWTYRRWPVAPDRLGPTVAGGQLAGIAILEHEPGGSTVTTRLRPLEALGRLCALSYRHDAMAAQLAALGELLFDVPVVLVCHGGAPAAAQAIVEWGIL